MTKRKWSFNDLKFLRDNAGVVPLHQLMLGLKRSKRAVVCKAERLGVSIAFYSVPWSAEEDSLLDKMRREGITGKEQAARLGRAYTAVLVRPYDRWLKENKEK